MKTALYFCGALLVTVWPAPSPAKSVTLQTVDLTGKGMSTEGGEAKLYRSADAKGSHCTIKAIHFGETGKTTYDFTFGSRLFSAERREYDYDKPIYADPNVNVSSIRTESLKTKAGSLTLPAAFKEYRSFFDARQLARCFRR